MSNIIDTMLTLIGVGIIVLYGWLWLAVFIEYWQRRHND